MSTSPASPSDAETPRRRRRGWQFSLRMLLVGTTVVALVLGYWADRVRKQRLAVQALRQRGASCEYRYPYGPKHWWPGWLERVVGIDSLDRVRAVWLRGETPTDADLEWLRAFRDLESLELRCAKVTDAGLVQLRTLTSLRELFIGDPQPVTAEMRRQGRIQVRSGHLSSGSRPTAPAGPWPFPAGEAEYGVEIAIDDSTFLEFDAYPLPAVFQYLSDYHAIDLEVTPAAQEVMNRPDGCPVTLTLRGVPLRTALDRLLRPLGLDWRLDGDSLLICGRAEAAPTTPITGAGLMEIEHLPGLEKLTLRACKLDGFGLRPLGRLPRLQSLDLIGTPLTEPALECFRDAPQLRELDLRGVQLTDAGLSFLEGKPELRRLCLGGTKISDAGLVHLAGLSHLEFLDLNGTAISDAGLAVLADKRELRSLCLSGTGISNAGLVHLAGLKQLRYLDLSETAVTEASLPQLEKLPELRELCLIGVSLSDAAVPSLVRMERLHTVHCDGRTISQAGWAILQETRHLGRSEWAAGPLKRAGPSPRPGTTP